MRQTTPRRLFVFVIGVLLARPVGGQAPPAQALDAAARRAIVDEIAGLLNAHYVFSATAEQMEAALRARLDSGGFAAQNDARGFATAIAGILSDVSRDGHIGFAFDPSGAAELARLRGRSEEEARKARERQRLAAQRNNFGFRRVERLPGNVGYLDLRSFDDPGIARPTAIAAMNFLAYCDAIIIDLRMNGGGAPAQIQLISSYLFAKPTHLNDLYERATDRTEHFWTLPNVPGPAPLDADLYVLTSRRTFSGAEEFAYNLKNLKRATIVGEVTGGGAHPTRPMIVRQDFVLRVPFARAINPISKTNWEGTGVTPDVHIRATAAFDKAYGLAIEALAAKTTDAARKSEYDWVLAGLMARRSGTRPDGATLAGYAGVYGPHHVTLDGDALVIQRPDGVRFRLLPLTATLFALEGLDSVRIEFVLKDGKADTLVMLQQNGRRDPAPRTK